MGVKLGRINEENMVTLKAFIVGQEEPITV